MCCTYTLHKQTHTFTKTQPHTNNYNKIGKDPVFFMVGAVFFITMLSYLWQSAGFNSDLRKAMREKFLFLGMLKRQKID